MKRSEMINLFIQKLNATQPLSTEPSDAECANLILSIVEDLGMLPPPGPRQPLAKLKNRCKWEPENE